MTLTKAMRICLAAVAVAAAGCLAGGLVLALRPARAANSRPVAAPPARRQPPSSHPTADGYSFTTLDNHSDPTFNQLLGINNSDSMVGYFGSGASGHPNRGYFLGPPYNQSGYVNLNYPHSVQTQITGLNDNSVQVGFWSSQSGAGQAGNDFGFYIQDGRFVSVNYPVKGKRPRAPVNQLLGVSDKGVAAGFYTDAAGHAHGYSYTFATRKFALVTVAGGVSVVAAAVNNGAGVAGFFTSSANVTKGFYDPPGGHTAVLGFPGAALTEALGVNDSGEVVGFYRLGTGSGASTHGFTWTQHSGFSTVDDPASPASTTVNGVNNAGDLVGFYTDSAGHDHGMLATPTG